MLSGSPGIQSTGPDPDRLLAGNRPAADVALGPSSGLNIPASTSQYLDPSDDGGSTGRPDVAPGPAGLPQADYVIVAETSAPHDTLVSAQVLPDLRFFGVVGTVGTGDGIDLYKLTLDSIPARLDFGVVMHGWNANVPATFQLLDGSGNVLGTWKLGGLGNSSIQVDLETPAPGATLYVGISAGSASTSGEAPGTGSYQLWVARQPALQSTSATTVSPAQLPLGVSALSSLLIPLASVGQSAPQGGSAAGLAAAPQRASISVSVTVGSLAIRSAGASRGLLDEPTPLAMQGNGTSAPREVAAAGSIARTDLDRGGESQPGQPALGRDPQAIVAVIDAGGFPLLGATAVGYWREQGPGPEALPGMTAPALEERSESVESSGNLELKLSPTLSLAEGEVLAQEQASRLRAWGKFPVSVFSGLGVATVLTLNAVLSQPIAGYDYLTAKLYRSRSQTFLRPNSTKRFATPH